MYPRSFLCEAAKMKQRTPLKKEICEIGEEAIWESWFTSFFGVGDYEFELKVHKFKMADQNGKKNYPVEVWHSGVCGSADTSVSSIFRKFEITIQYGG